MSAPELNGQPVFLKPIWQRVATTLSKTPFWDPHCPCQEAGQLPLPTSPISLAAGPVNAGNAPETKFLCWEVFLLWNENP